MNRYKPPTRSRAAPDTLCQKCLKKGHYSYECTAKHQERPYAARPSRTQQLFNPKLLPKLTNDVPVDLQRRKGVADEQLAQKEQERATKRARDTEEINRPRKRSRSMSSRSDSISTISTNRSRSPPARHDRQRQRKHSPAPARNGYHSKHDDHNGGKRRRSRSSSSESEYSTFSDGMREARAQDRNTRRRMSSYSPSSRGRRRIRQSLKKSMERSRSRSRTPPRRQHSRSRSRRPRRAGRSPSRSPVPHREHADEPAPSYSQPAPIPSPPSRKERSLSPFSKRLAMTRAMNHGSQGAVGSVGNPPPWR